MKLNRTLVLAAAAGFYLIAVDPAWAQFEEIFATPFESAKQFLFTIVGPVVVLAILVFAAVLVIRGNIPGFAAGVFTAVCVAFAIGFYEQILSIAGLG